METSGRASQKRNMPSTRERWSDEPKLTSSYCCTVPDWLKPLGWRLCGGWWGWWRHRLLWGVERLFLLQGQDTNNWTIESSIHQVCRGDIHTSGGTLLWDNRRILGRKLPVLTRELFLRRFPPIIHTETIPSEKYFTISAWSPNYS